MVSDILLSLERNEKVASLIQALNDSREGGVFVNNLAGSSSAFVFASALKHISINHLFILPEIEESIYFFNDLEGLLPERDILYYPSSDEYKRKGTENDTQLRRTEALNTLRKSSNQIMVAPIHALFEKVADRRTIESNSLQIATGDKLSMDFIIELLSQYNFMSADFVTDPGQYSKRGGIVDIFSFSHERPYRLEFYGDTVESIRSFDAITQLSIEDTKRIELVPDFRNSVSSGAYQSLLEYIGLDALCLWLKDFPLLVTQVAEFHNSISLQEATTDPLLSVIEFEKQCRERKRVMWGIKPGEDARQIEFHSQPQKPFANKFELLFEEIAQNIAQGYKNYVFTDTPQQMQRLRELFSDTKISSAFHFELDEALIPVFLPIYRGFILHDIKTACYSDHEIFGRYLRFRLKDSYYKTKESLTIRELQDLKPGDFVTHIDHGVGRFAGLDMIEVNGKMQEVVRIMYKDNDLLYVSIHSLHRISRYSSRDGYVPSIDKLGSGAWKSLKQKTRKKIKELAFDLIKLYSERKNKAGFAFQPDTYLQTELEASFIYEDTPDQYKATADVKKDMEQPHPMDRLVCGDVGFGKTEVAIRAAFKAVTDSKQVAILVPTTILALQHFKTFSSRLREFPCSIDYLNRFRSPGARKEILHKLESGQLDIIIGTHQLASQNVKFNDLGLLIVDEEQKFGVSIKDKLKTLRSTVDILTLTATPIPRTLQFSLIGVRDLSVINTPPPNRYPVHTEIANFSGEIFRNAIRNEIARGGQVFVIHNRVQSIQDIAAFLHGLCPEAKIGIAHGQLKGHHLEEIMFQFIEGQLDVLVSTAIVESGLDIPNLNTIIINDAQIFGLSDLHQLRGRAGRSDKKAFCYLVTPPYDTLSREAKSRLETIEQFSDLGSGFNIAMRDLDLRGAGDLLGGEQSGFINDMGIDTYYKILNEVVEELKEEVNVENEGEEEGGTQKTIKRFVRDCQVDTDAQALIPDDYVQNAKERLRLYRELNEAKQEQEINNFEKELTDRFGPIPEPVFELLNIVRLRLLAAELGIERIIYKNNVVYCHFISNPEQQDEAGTSPSDSQAGFYASATFRDIVEYIKSHPANCTLKQSSDKVILTITNVTNVKQALEILMAMSGIG